MSDLLPDVNADSSPVSSHHQEHFVPENFNSDGTLKAGSHPSLFEGGKKKVILKPSATSSSTPAKQKSELQHASLSYQPPKTWAAPFVYSGAYTYCIGFRQSVAIKNIAVT